MPVPPYIARAFTRALGGRRSVERTDGLAFADAGHGFDPFGMHPDFVAMGDALVGPLHDRYFRVRAVDPHHIPATGPAILAANHSGTVAFDGMMLWVSVLRNTHPPRAPRPVADYFVSTLPFLGTLFARGGAIGGSRGNVRRLLEMGDLLMLFPEGTPGISKPFSERYRLQNWRKGHCEFALRYNAPIIPVGIVGAEEQMPQIGRIPLEPLGLAVPHIPITATPIPLPVRYHILYGEPMHFSEFSTDDADDPEIVTACAQRVREAVEGLIARGLRERKGVFA